MYLAMEVFFVMLKSKFWMDCLTDVDFCCCNTCYFINIFFLSLNLKFAKLNCVIFLLKNNNVKIYVEKQLIQTLLHYNHGI